MFSFRLSSLTLSVHCRSLRHLLDAGLTIERAMKQQAQRGPVAIRPVAQRIAEQLEEGEEYQAALKSEAKRFPPLFIALIAVGEDTGRLTEILGELAEYFDLQIKLRRQFIGQISWPLFQFAAAIAVLSLLIFLRGFIPGIADFTGMGLKGTGGALWFVGWIAAALVALWGLYRLGKGLLNSWASVEAVLLDIPTIGPSIRALALYRFCMAFFMTVEAGVPIRRALRLSLQATGNAAFANASHKAESVIRRGKSILEALAKTRLFPETFLTVMETAEESGQIAEVMRREAKVHHEEAARRLRALTAVAGAVIWLMVAVFIIMAIMSIYGAAFQQRDDLIRDLGF